MNKLQNLTITKNFIQSVLNHILRIFQIERNKALGQDGRNLLSMKEAGYAAVFIGIGLPQPKTIPVFKGLSLQQGYYSSKDFLPLVAKASKPGKK